MRLVKLLAYTLLGYVLYELYLGVTEGVEAASSGVGPRKKVAVEDATGGRGVVH